LKNGRVVFYITSYSIFKGLRKNYASFDTVKKILASKVANKWRLKKIDIDIYLKSNASGKEY
jgi:hypothetical protein